MVAIKNMEFPKYCNDCEFCHDSSSFCSLMDEKIPGYDFFKDGNEKPDFCPLVEIIACKDCELNDEGSCEMDGCGVTDDSYCYCARRRR